MVSRTAIRTPPAPSRGSVVGEVPLLPLLCRVERVDEVAGFVQGAHRRLCAE